jgi:hypothetical protein
MTARDGLSSDAEGMTEEWIRLDLRNIPEVVQYLSRDVVAVTLPEKVSRGKHTRG